jgi:hypothetical protein
VEYLTHSWSRVLLLSQNRIWKKAKIPTKTNRNNCPNNSDPNLRAVQNKKFKISTSTVIRRIDCSHSKPEKCLWTCLTPRSTSKTSN